MIGVRLSAPTGCLRYPPSPDGRTIYAIGDIHGRLDLLERVHRAIDSDIARTRPDHTTEIYLGDYIDRGSYSAGVVSCLIRRASEAHTIFLRGNHEQMLIDFVDGVDCWERWKAIGGVTTLLSYGVQSKYVSRAVSPETLRHALADRLPEEHKAFYSDTGSYCRVGPYLLVHAGLRPGVALENQSAQDLLGIRREFLEFEGDLGFIVVHGHTPVLAPDLRPNRINIDTGAFATNRLTCLKIDLDGARTLAV